MADDTCQKTSRLHKLREEKNVKATDEYHTQANLFKCLQKEHLSDSVGHNNIQEPELGDG